MSDPFSRPAEAREVLESWKEIAAYLGRSVRAVQLWEKEENLPIHRHQHDKQGTVFAYRDEIDRWREARTAPPPPLAPHLVFPAADEVPPVKEAPAPRRSRYIAGAVVAAVVMATLGAVFWQQAAVEPSIRSIAVLPFTSTPDLEHVSDGLTELLIDELATLPELRVMARSSVFHYKDKAASPVRAGRELDVGAVMTGRVRRENDRYIVRVELIDVRDGAQLWAGGYEAAPAELPSLEGRIFADVSTRLHSGTPAAKYTANAEAYEEYLLGLREWNRRSSGSRRHKDALPQALAHYERAIELDPRFAAAYAGLANTYGVMIGFGAMDPGEGTVRVLAAARKAIELDPNNAEAYTSIATTEFKTLRDYESAERNYRRAIALNPNFATAHQWFSTYLQTMGRFDEGRREIELAYRLDPLSGPITSEYCYDLYNERRYREAIRFVQDVEARDPERAPIWCATASLLALGDFDAFFEYRRTRGTPPLDESARELFRRRGWQGFYERRLESGLKRPVTNPLLLARGYALVGDADQAFAWLEKAYQQRLSEAPVFHLEPELDSIRDDPRFADLARRLGLPPAALEATRALARKAPHPTVAITGSGSGTPPRSTAPPAD